MLGATVDAGAGAGASCLIAGEEGEVSEQAHFSCDALLTGLGAVDVCPMR